MVKVKSKGEETFFFLSEGTEFMYNTPTVTRNCILKIPLNNFLGGYIPNGIDVKLQAAV